jgi:hypothetical protein
MILTVWFLKLQMSVLLMNLRILRLVACIDRVHDTKLLGVVLMIG